MHSLCDRIGIECRFDAYCEAPHPSEDASRDLLDRVAASDLALLFLQLFDERRVAKREYIPGDDLQQLTETYARAGYRVHCRPQVGWLHPEKYRSGPNFTLTVYSEESELQRFLPLDLAHDPRSGALLGYPDCCIAEYALEEAGNGTHIDQRWREKLFPDGTFVCPLINPRGSLLLHIPCSRTCRRSVQMAQRVLGHMERELGERFLRQYFAFVKG